MIRVLDRLRMRCSVGVVVKRARVVAMVSQKRSMITGHRRTFQRDSVDHGGAVVGRTWPDITETIAHQTTCYPFQTLLNTKRQTRPKRTSPSHRSMRLFTFSLFTLTCSLTTRWTHLNYNSRFSWLLAGICRYYGYM